MRDVERDGEHMWLRQSVTFSVDGQSRTLEIGIPLRVGATPDEIETLLAEADAGMERIGRHLEARVTRLAGSDAASAPPAASAPIAEPLAVPAAESAPVSEQAVTPPAAPPAPPAAPTPTAAPAPAVTPTPARAIAERPAPPLSAPTKPAAAQAQVTPPAARSAAPAGAGTPMALPEFIATVQAEQGLNPKQAMEKLGVKSLAGLNLREALEMLRRQALRNGAEPVPAVEPAATPAPAAAEPIAAEPRHYFDEEDDAADIIFTEEDDELDAETAAAGEDAELPSAYDDDELDEVPDFGSPPAELPTAEPANAAADQASASVTAASEGPAPGESRANRILTHMRGMRGGGVASAQQRNAFKNIVVAELGEPKAKALIAGIWRITPEKLGPEQLDALNNWGKRDTFADDAELVLAAVKAEREREREQERAEPGAGSGGAPSATSTRGATRRTSRAAPSGGA